MGEKESNYVRINRLLVRECFIEYKEEIGKVRINKNCKIEQYSERIQ